MKFILDYKRYAEIARETAEEGCVLLRNEDSALPICMRERVSVFGRMQFTYCKSGTGSGGMVNAPYVTNIIDCLKECPNITVNEELEKCYREWLDLNPFDQGGGWAQEPWCQKEMPVSEEMVRKAASRSDVAVIVLGRTAGEDHDNSETKGSYLLTDEEEDMIARVCSAFKRTAVVLNVGNIIDMKWVERYYPQAVLYVWQGGQEGGRAAARILTGEVNPSGRLADTIARNISDYPSSGNFGDPDCNIYREDIYVGYRYFETFARKKVLYPFGFGLSYTEFDWSADKVEMAGMKMKLEVRVRNTGRRAGREVIQIYVCPPQGRLGKATRSLVDFQKTKRLVPGEEQVLSFELALEDAASYDDVGVTGYRSYYVLEAGEYGVYVGTDVRNTQKAVMFQLGKTVPVRRLQEAVAPDRDFERLRAEESVDGELTEGWESVLSGTADLDMRIAKNQEKMGRELYSGKCLKEFAEMKPGDRGIRLADVYDGKVSMMDFLSQLTDEELTCMTRGEGMCSSKVTPGTAAAFGGVTKRLTQYGIPVACCSDGPSGIRMDCGTMAYSLPNGTLLACTFDTELVEKLYELEGMELRKNRIDTLLGPGMNIHRNPLNGRNFEYFSEDPLLTGKMAAAQLKGMRKYGVTGTIKHFAGNNQEFRRHDANAVVSERALREIYLKGFEIAVKEGKAYSVMSTYGPVNGIWTAGNYDLLTTILRGEWGFDGIVMTDWWAKINEKGGKAEQNNTIPMVRAQNDLYMVVSDSESNSARDNTMSGIQEGKILRMELLRNASNICNFLMRSPVMNRFLGRETDVWEEVNSPEQEMLAGLALGSTEVDTDTELPLEGLDTGRGRRAVYRLLIKTAGSYSIQMKVRSDANEVAQMPVSVFWDTKLIATVTMNGTEGKWTEQTVGLGKQQVKEHYLTLFFGEGGLEFGGLYLKKKVEEGVQKGEKP